MKKGKYIDYTCLMACLSHNKRTDSAISELLEEVKAGEKLTEKLWLSEKTNNVNKQLPEMAN